MSQSIFEPDPEPVRGKSDAGRVVLFVLLGVGVFFMLFCAGIGLLIYWGVRQGIEQVQRAQDAQKHIMPRVSIEPLEQRQADFRTAFASPDPGVGERTLTELRAHFNEVIEAAKADDDRRFRRIFMANRFMVEVDKTGLVPKMTQTEHQAYADAFQNEWIELPDRWTRYRIVHVKPLGFEYVVTVCFWDEDGDISEWRYWVTGAVGGMRCFDWEDIGFGARRSLEAAVYLKYGDEPQYNDHLQVGNDLDACHEAGGQGRRAEAITLLKRAETRWQPPELADLRLVTLAYYWQTLGKNGESLRRARQVREPVATPGAFHAQALAFQNLGAYRRALEMAKNYEAAAGGSPRACKLRAGLHGRLGETADAAEYWRKYLTFDPDNVEALVSLAGSLDETNRHILAERISATSRPAEIASEVANSLVYSDNAEALRALSDFVKGLEPDSARVAFLQGLLAQAEEDYVAAGDHFKTALESESDPEARDDYLMHFLDAMSSAGQPVAGYEQAPDQDAAFRHLLEGSDEDEPALKTSDRRALIEAHRRRHPDDPQIPYFSGLLLREENDLEGAPRELARALEVADDDDRAGRRWALVSALHDASRDIEAYETIAPAAETFRDLIQLNRWDETAEDRDRLKELHRLHEAAHPGDGWLDFCAALIQRREKNTAEALRLARRGYDQTNDETLKSQYQWLVVELGLEERDFEAASGVFANRDEALLRLGQRIPSKEEADKLDSLLAWHLANGGRKSSQWWSLKVQSMWNRHDYAGVIEGCDSLLGAPENDLSDWELRRFAEWQVQGLLKLGRRDEAMRKARALYDDTAQVRPLLFACAAGNDAAQFERLLAERDLQSYELQGLYREPEIGPVLASADFLPVRRKFPPSLSEWTGDSDAVLLLASPVSLTPDDLKTAAESAFGDGTTVEPLDQPAGFKQSDVTGQWLIRSGESRLIVTTATGSFPTSPSTRGRSTKLANERLNRALDDHKAWLTVDQIEGRIGDANDRPAVALGLRLAGRLIHDDCLALYAEHIGRLIEPSAELRVALQSEDPSPALAKLGTTHWMSRPSADETREERNRARAFTKSLKQMAAALQSREPGQLFEIVAAVHSTSAVELVRVVVEAAEPGPYRQLQFTGTLREPSRFLPRLTAGEPVAVSAHQVVEWSMTDGQEHKGARKGE